MTTAIEHAHGTYKRAVGNRRSGVPRCPCRPCREAEGRYDKRRRYLTATGNSLLTDATPVAEHLATLTASGDALAVIARRLGRSRGTLTRITNGRARTVSRTIANEILALTPGRSIAPNSGIPALGSIRRTRALVALGHTCLTIRAKSGVERTVVSSLLNGHVETVAFSTTQAVAAGYRNLGQRAGNSTRSLLRAERELWAPPAAWDDIDDPDALPDWTGYCGTDRGWWSHRVMRKEPCPRCQDAHAAWLAERKNLTSPERFQQMALARAAASNRGAAIAEDARELFRQGLNRQQVAERLGIVPSHLDHELARHPKADEPATQTDDEAAA